MEGSTGSTASGIHCCKSALGMHLPEAVVTYRTVSVHVDYSVLAGHWVGR
jgi:hypothetical protein